MNERTAAVMIEPVQGRPASSIAGEVLVAARAACARLGALLVFDEVQCGMGRTGTLWAYERLGSARCPDRRRRWAAGLPVGAAIISAQLGDGLTLGDHGSTFAGGPVAAAALAALDALDDPQLLGQVGALGDRLRSGSQSSVPSSMFADAG